MRAVCLCGTFLFFSLTIPNLMPHHGLRFFVKKCCS
nr:MAG TPA: hypothetical protein [Caudoviricetes sp.]